MFSKLKTNFSFILSRYEDLEDLDKNKTFPGATAFIVETSKTYMLNNYGQWIGIQMKTSQMPSYYDAGDIKNKRTETPDSVIYDGGDLDQN